MSVTPVILILIALLSAVVGTLWDARPWGKALIIVLAAASAGTAMHESIENSRATEKAEAEAADARRSLDLLVRAIQPPAIFDDAVLDALRTNAEEHEMFVSGQSISEDGSRIFEFNLQEKENELAGLIHLDVATRQELFVAFAKGEALVPRTSNILFGKWGNDDLVNDWNIFAMMTYEIGRHALSELIPFDLEYRGEFDPEKRTVYIEADGFGQVTYDDPFMNALVALPPAKRGLLIYLRTVRQAGRWSQE